MDPQTLARLQKLQPQQVISQKPYQPYPSILLQGSLSPEQMARSIARRARLSPENTSAQIFLTNSGYGPPSGGFRNMGQVDQTYQTMFGAAGPQQGMAAAEDPTAFARYLTGQQLRDEDRDGEMSAVVKATEDRRDMLPKGQLVATNNEWFRNLNPIDQMAVIEHNRGVMDLIQNMPTDDPFTSRNQNEAMASVNVPLYDGGPAQIQGTQFNVVKDYIGESTEGGDQTPLAGNVGQRGTNDPLAMDRDIGVDTKPLVNSKSSTFLPDGARSPESGSSGTRFGADNDLSATQLYNIMGDNRALTEYLLQREGNLTPSSSALYQPGMNVASLLFLMENADSLAMTPDQINGQGFDVDEYIDQAMQNLDPMSGIDFAQSVLDAQRGGGIDTEAALRQLFEVGATSPNQGMTANPLQYQANYGSPQQQVEWTTGAIGSLLSTGNPYMADTMMILLDALGARYLQQGGSEEGFLNWLMKNSFLGAMAQGQGV